MGLSRSRSLLPLFILSFGGWLQAAPVLRLVSSTVGPIVVAQNAPAGTRTIEAFNAGDGSLSLQLSSSVTWISPSIGAARNCATTTEARTCIPLQLALNTAGLAPGLQSGIVTVKDPNAWDAPQTIVVTVRVGGFDAYVAAETSQDVFFTTTSQVNSRSSTNSGGSWLTVALDGTGSFRFELPYRVRMNAAGLSQGTYTGSVTTTGAAMASENQTIPVTMRVTAQPIARATPDSLSVRLAQGAPATAAAIAISNDGQGSLSVQGATASGQGISATIASGVPVVTLDPGTLSPGVYSGSVAITTNAVNGTVNVPVSFEVIAKDAPLISYQGVVDNAIYSPDPVSPGDIVIVKGEQFSFGSLTLGQAAPLAKQIGGAEVLVNGTPAPMYYSSYGQLAFQMPVDTPPGLGRIQVRRDGLTSNTATVTVAERAPRILTLRGTEWGAIYNSDFTIPIASTTFPDIPSHPASVGDTLQIYAIGMGATAPAVATGDPAPGGPLAQLVNTPMVVFGSSIAGIPVTPSFAGLAPGFAGLYQINAQVPEGVTKGIVNLVVSFGNAVSNPVQIVVQ